MFLKKLFILVSERKETAAHNCKDKERLEKEIEKEIHKLKNFLGETDDLIQLKGYTEMEIENRKAEKIREKLSDLLRSRRS